MTPEEKEKSRKEQVQACHEIVDWFRDLMLKKLLDEQNLSKGGWRTTNRIVLAERFYQERRELEEVLSYGAGEEDVDGKMADFANLWAMLRDPKRVEPVRQKKRH